MRYEVWFSRLTPNLCVLLVIPAFAGITRPFISKRAKIVLSAAFLILEETAVAAPHLLFRCTHVAMVTAMRRET